MPIKTPDGARCTLRRCIRMLKSRSESGVSSGTLQLTSRQACVLLAPQCPLNCPVLHLHAPCRSECGLLCQQITSLECDAAHEILWAGTESGGLYALQCPTLKRYAGFRCLCVKSLCSDRGAGRRMVRGVDTSLSNNVFRGHDGRIDDLLAASDGGALSLSATNLKLHSVGGIVKTSISASQARRLLFGRTE